MLPTGLGRGATFSPFVPLLWLACICVPSRPTTQDDWGGMSTTTTLLPGLTHLAEVDEGRYQYQIREKKAPHIRLDSRFAFNAFYMCGETKRAEISACRHQAG